MPRLPVYPTAAAALDAFITEHFAPQMKAAGFRKQRRTFSSRSGSLIRILSFQGSQWSTSEELGFYIRLGAWSDKIAAFRPYAEFGWNLPVKPKSATWVPAERHWHWNTDIEQIAKDVWRGPLSIDCGEHPPQLVKLLQKGVFEHAMPFLQQIDSEAALLKHIRGDVEDATGPLNVAALYSIAAPSEFQAFARKLDRVDDDENARVWRICLQRMGYRPTKS